MQGMGLGRSTPSTGLGDSRALLCLAPPAPWEGPPFLPRHGARAGRRHRLGLRAAVLGQMTARQEAEAPALPCEGGRGGGCCGPPDAVRGGPRPSQQRRAAGEAVAQVPRRPAMGEVRGRCSLWHGEGVVGPGAQPGLAGGGGDGKGHVAAVSAEGRQWARKPWQEQEGSTRAATR